MKNFKVLLALIIFSTLAACGANIPGSESKIVACEDSSTDPKCDTKKINTQGWEDSLLVSLDGTELYFTYTPWNFFPAFEGGIPKYVGPDRPGQLPAYNPWENPTTYVSKRDADGRWGSPVAAPFNVKGGVCCAMVTSDRKEVYYQREMSDSGDDVVYSVLQTDETWSDPIVFGTQINSKRDEGNPHLSANGKTLWWSSNREDGLGGHDLWFSEKSDKGEWSQAQNMGEAINSSDEEEQPWVSTAGDHLVFAKGLEIYESRKVGGEWSTATPVHFETTVEAGEPTITAKGDEMYMVVVDRLGRDLIVSVSKKLSSGAWSTPVPVPEAE